jgi:hypothetical protein
MAEDTLVAADIEQGAALVRALDNAGFPVLAAMWLYRPDLEAWKLTIATPRAATLLDALGEVSEIAERAGLKHFDLLDVSLVLPQERTVSTLSRSRRLEGLGGVRLSTSMIDGVYIEDAYVYRAAA